MDVWRPVFGALRGRYAVVLGFGLVVGAACAIAGAKVGRVQYESEGLLRIASSKQQVMSDQAQQMGMYDAFMRSQQLLISSRRMLDAALRTEIWKRTGLGDSPQVIEQFSNNLRVEVVRGAENLRVTFAGENPTIAAAAVNAIIRAYEDEYKTAEGGFQQKRLSLVAELEAEHRRALDDLNKRLAALSGGGQVDIQQMHAAAVQRLIQYEGRLADVDLGLALSTSRGPKDTVQAMRSMTPNQIAMADPTMRGYLAEQRRLEGELAQLELRLGGANERVIGLKRMVEAAKAQVAQYASDFQQWQVEVARNPDPSRNGGVVATFLQPVEVLQAQREVMAKLVDQARQEVASLSSKRDEAETLRVMLAKTRKGLDETLDRKSILSLESELGDRLEVTSRGEVPLTPARNTRVRFAAAGAVAGGLLPAAIVAMFGTVRRRYRFADEAGEAAGGRRMPLLGVLPVLPARVMDAEQASDAAQCVHRIRVMLQGAAAGGPQVYLVSSSSAQEGKTSLCVALGLSFAASGARTLLVDADFVGRGLTRGLAAEGLPGLLEAMETGRLNVEERPDRLSVLTAGKAEAADTCKVSGASMRRVLEQARRHFDVVLVDSGPIMGSVEAAVVAREVEGVVFLIARGQDSAAVGHSLRHFESMGVTVMGAVFNRAKVQDFYRSVQGSSMKSASPDAAGRPRRAADGTGFDNPAMFGPLVGCVASTLSAVNRRGA